MGIDAEKTLTHTNELMKEGDNEIMGS